MTARTTAAKFHGLAPEPAYPALPVSSLRQRETLPGASALGAFLNLTGWYPDWMRPVWPGVYRTKLFDGTEGYSYSSPFDVAGLSHWGVQCATPQAASEQRFTGDVMRRHWCGLASPAHVSSIGG